MATKAFQKVYTKLEAITKATVALKASGVSNDELALVDGRLAQVVKTKGDLVTLQIFSGTEGLLGLCLLFDEHQEVEPQCWPALRAPADQLL